MTIVAYFPIKGSLTHSESKFPQPGDQLAQPGHYFSCPDCGFCSRIFTGEDSKLRAIAAAHHHAQAKADAEDQRAAELVVESPAFARPLPGEGVQAYRRRVGTYRYPSGKHAPDGAPV